MLNTSKTKLNTNIIIVYNYPRINPYQPLRGKCVKEQSLCYLSVYKSSGCGFDFPSPFITMSPKNCVTGSKSKEPTGLLTVTGTVK